jgi:hypothetical protein
MSRKKAPHLQSQLWFRAAPALVGLTALAVGTSAGAATTISTATTTPVATSTVNSGAADDITVTSDGSIKPTSGVAVTLDSNNAVSNAGTIYYRDVDNVTDVLLKGGVTGSFTNSGTLEADETHTDTDTNGDGNYDGVFATGTGRYGVRLVGTSAFVGDITLASGSTITIRGNDSAGVELDAALQGALLNVGSIGAYGDRVYGIHALSSISGNVGLRGAISTTGLGAVAAEFDDNIGGQLLVQNSVISTGYRYTSRSSTQSVLDALGADDLLQGGSALVVKGDVAGGILLEIPPTLDSSNTDVDGDGYTDTAEGSASVISYGAAPAIVIGASGRTVTVGDVGTGGDAYGFVNRGTVAGAGVYDGVSATGLQIGVAGGVVNLTGGISNQGSIGASSYDADSIALHILANSSAYTFVNAGSTSAVLTGDTAHSATAVLIEAGAYVPNLINSLDHTISAAVIGVTGTSTVAGDATAIRDLSGTLTSIINNGTIAATITPTSVSSTDSTTQTVTGKAVALDLTANTTGVSLVQSTSDTDYEPSIVGAIELGSGGDSVQILNGTVTGDISFGAGANSLTIDGDSTVKGDLTATGGTLALSLLSGSLDITNVGVLNLSSLSLSSSSTLTMTIDPDSGTYTSLVVAGPATLASGAKIGLNLTSLLVGEASYVIVKSTSLNSGVLDTSLLGNVPYLYDAGLTTDAAAGTVTVDLALKSATQLGLPASTSQAYAPMIAAIDTDTTVRDAFLALKTRAGFTKAYNQLLPEHGGGVFESVSANVDAFARAIDDRQGPDAGGFWIQQTGFTMTHDGSDDAPGYTAGGIGLIGGREWSAGSLGVIGATLGGSSSHVNPDAASGASKLTVNTFEGGGYWRYVSGNLTLNARLAGSYLQTSSHRAIYILNDDGDGLLAKAVANAKWSGWAMNGRVAATYEGHIGSIYARPSASLDYLRLEEDAYSEKDGGDAVDLHVSARQSSRSTGFAGVVTGTRYGDQDSWWGPEVTLGYREVGSGELGSTTAKFLSGTTSFNVLADEIKGGGVVARIAVKGENAGGAFVVEGGAETRDATAIYDLRLAAHFKF